jgi:DNA-binding NarL/FixJ family response regulator
MNQRRAPASEDPRAEVGRLGSAIAGTAPAGRTAQQGLPNRRVRLLICGDNRLMTGALATVMRHSGDIELATDPVASGREAISLAAELQPDVVLIALRSGGAIDAIEAADRIIEESPEIAVLLMIHERSDIRLFEAIEAGASGVIHDGDDVDDLLNAVRRASRGDVLVDPKRLPQLARRAALERRRRSDVERRLETLTQREHEILALLRRGLRNDRIGEQLFISPRTVETHVQHVMRKLGVHSKLEAAAFGMHDDIVETK